MDVKLIAGGYKIPATINIDPDRIEVRFGFNRPLLEEIKAFNGARWNPDGKFWYFPNNDRNWFQLQYLQGENPYERYDSELPPYKSATRPLYQHQNDGVAFMLHRRSCLFAAEMGLGKTASVYETIEQAQIVDNVTYGQGDVWYIGPNSALISAKVDAKKWNYTVPTTYMTFDAATSTINNWINGVMAPKFLVIDEGARVKDHRTKRSKAIMNLANGMRKDWGDKARIVILSGAPAPKAPTDWWHQCEILCPGFLKEGDVHKFDRTLSWLEQQDSPTGGSYQRRLGWKDNEIKCFHCGELKDHYNHTNASSDKYHGYKCSVNEVMRLYKRMNGLVLVKRKKDCLDLPEKRYVRIQCTPTKDTLRVAGLIKRISPRAITALTLLRELSDGFQYVDKPTDRKTTCDICKGSGVQNFYNERGEVTGNEQCFTCKGTKEVPVMERTITKMHTAKDDKLIELLEQHEEVGRLVIFAGFEASVSKCQEIANSKGWTVIRADGRGWYFIYPDGKISDSITRPEDMIGIFQGIKDATDNKEDLQICVVGNPGTISTGLTLTASPSSVYYSNTFNGDDRIQSEDRIHRIGMDMVRGGVIYDLIHLPSDEHVLDNLQKKKDLLNMTLGDIPDTFVGDRDV